MFLHLPLKGDLAKEIANRNKKHLTNKVLAQYKKDQQAKETS